MLYSYYNIYFNRDKNKKLFFKIKIRSAKMPDEFKEENNDLFFKFGDTELLESFNNNKYADMLMDFSNQNKNIHLDFSEVDVVDSLFIGSLIIVHKKLEAQNKTLYLKNLNEFLLDLFSKLRLGSIL